MIDGVVAVVTVSTAGVASGVGEAHGHDEVSVITLATTAAFNDLNRRRKARKAE